MWIINYQYMNIINLILYYVLLIYLAMRPALLIILSEKVIQIVWISSLWIKKKR